MCHDFVLIMYLFYFRDTKFIKRHLNSPIIISNGYHCLTCARAKKYLTRRKAQLLKNYPPKRKTIKTTPKTKKKLVLLQKKNELLRKQKKL